LNVVKRRKAPEEKRNQGQNQKDAGEGKKKTEKMAYHDFTVRHDLHGKKKRKDALLHVCQARKNKKEVKKTGTSPVRGRRKTVESPAIVEK